MEKRDLQRSLDQLRKTPPLAITLHTISAERDYMYAIEVEKLARELARDLKEIKKRGDWLKRDCMESDKVMGYAISINVIGKGALARAKEVLGNA